MCGTVRLRFDANYARPNGILICVLVETMNLRMVAERLMFRSEDGSLALAGIWMIGVGIVMVVGSMANVVGRGPAKRMAERVPRILIIVWGFLGLAGGAFFIAWPFLASPGKLY